MNNTLRILVVISMISLSLVSCLGDAKEKFKEARNGVSNATTLVKEATKVESRMEKLKNETPLTNAQLKEWLPLSLGNLERSGFKIGQAGFAGVNSVEGTFKVSGSKQSFNVMIIDGAGPAGSAMAAGYGMFGNLEMEVEDERKHQQTVTVNGIKAQQTYYKRNNNTQLMFLYDERFVVTIDSKDMDAQSTWDMTKKLDLDKLSK